MLISKSDAVSIIVPSSLASNKIPFNTGKVVLVETAFETVLRAFDNFCWLQVNFIISSGKKYSLLLYYNFSNSSSRGCGFVNKCLCC
jgi:hypothetical protein